MFVKAVVMNIFPAYELSLRIKVLILITVTVVTVSGLVSVVFLNFFMQKMVDQLQNRGDAIVQNLANDSYFPILTEDSILLKQQIKANLNQPGVQYVIIMDRNGKVLEASDQKYYQKNIKLYKSLKNKYSGVVSILNLKEAGLVNFSMDVWQKKISPLEDDIAPLTNVKAATSPLEKSKVKFGTVHVGFSLLGLREMLLNLIWVEFLASLASVVTIVFTLFVVIQKKISTISLLSKVARKVADNKGEQVVIPANEFKKHQQDSMLERDEISDLFFSFENMLNQLNTYYLYVHENTRELEEASTAKSNFLATVSHEFRTPLNAIIGYCDLMIMDHEEGKVPEIKDTERINKAAEHLLNLINNVLDISKMESGKESLLLEDVSLNNLVSSSVAMCNVIAHKNDNNIIVDIELGSVFIKTDKTKLSQCLINLISNACKFTKAGTITISIYKDPRLGIVFIVKDTGIGIPQEKLKKIIFDPFTQADNTITREYGGTGLGLTVTKKLVELLGGKITVKSKLNIGTEFKFWIKAETYEC